MILEDLRIQLSTFGRDKGKYKGRATFVNEQGSVTINLTKKHCENIFSICADGIIDTAKEAADSLTISVIEHDAAIDKIKEL